MTPISVANVMKLSFRNPILLSSSGPSPSPFKHFLNIFCSLPIVNWRLVKHNSQLIQSQESVEKVSRAWWAKWMISHIHVSMILFCDISKLPVIVSYVEWWLIADLSSKKAWHFVELIMVNGTCFIRSISQEWPKVGLTELWLTHLSPRNLGTGINLLWG